MRCCERTSEIRAQMNDRENNRPQPHCAPTRRAFSLVELLIVLSIVGVLAALIVPHLDPGMQSQLESAGEIVAGDLAYARSLAVANNSSYEITFNPSGNRYTLRHSGGNTLLDALPPSPHHHPDDPPDEQITDFDELPHLGPAARLEVVLRMTSPPQQVASVEFGPLGETTRSEPTVIWLSIGGGDGQRRLPIRIDPISGLADVGRLQAAPPPAASPGP